MNVKVATKEDMDALYESDGLAFLNRNFSALINDAGAFAEFNMLLNSCKIKLKEDTTVYVVSGKLMDEYYDLEGDNAFRSKYYSIIKFEDLDIPEFMSEMDGIRLLGSLYATSWIRVVDIANYVEYTKGRHELTEDIKYLVDINSDDGETVI